MNHRLVWLHIDSRLPLLGLLLVFADSATARAEESLTPSTIRVAIYADAGVTKKDLPELQRCLPASERFEVTLVTAEQVRAGTLKDIDVVIHPGGSGSGQAKALGNDGRQRVRQFVEGGGGFVGICAGAYLGSAEYPWALKLLDARVVDDEHWARGVGEVKLRLPPAGRAALDFENEVTTIHYENGPLLGPAEKNDIPDYESLADFETEIASNGAPSGVMKGTSAIARGRFGAGRVVCFSPHPEKTPGREPFVRAAVRWAGRQGVDDQSNREE